MFIKQNKFLTQSGVNSGKLGNKEKFKMRSARLSAYDFGGKTFFLMYSSSPKVMQRAPHFATNPEHVSQVAYRKTRNFEGGIDFWMNAHLVDGDEAKKMTDETKFQRWKLEDSLRLSKPEVLEIERKHRVRYQIPKQFRELEPGIRRMTAHDILFYWENQNKAPLRIAPEDPEINYVDQLSPETAFLLGKSHASLTSGKQSFVPACVFDANIDLLIGGCSAECDDEGFVDLFKSCEYCYADYKHGAGRTLARVEEEKLTKMLLDKAQNLKDLEENPISLEELGRRPILRFGKKQDPGSQYTTRQLISGLRACGNAGWGAAVATKFLRFDEQVLKAAAKGHTSIVYSLGRDDLETGACESGLNNLERVQEGVKLFKEVKNKGLDDRVNIGFFALVDPLRSIEENAFRESLKMALEANADLSMGITLLPIRVRGGRHAEKIFGIDWRTLIEPRGQEDFTTPSGLLVPKGYISLDKTQTKVAGGFHPEIAGLVGDNHGNVGLCHKTTRKTYCSGCHIPEIPKTITPTIKINREKIKKKGDPVKAAKRKKKDRGQLLFEDM